MKNTTYNLSHLYQLRQDFIVIGLTGKTGSGCSHFAELMSNTSFEDCEFPEPNMLPSAGNNERKYRIAYNFLKNNWEPFFVIKYSKVISLIAYREQLAKCEDLIYATYGEFSDKKKFPDLPVFDDELQALVELRNRTKFVEFPNDEVELYKFFISPEFETFDKDFHQALAVRRRINRILILHTFCNNLRQGGCYYCGLDPSLTSIYEFAKVIKAIIKGKRRLDKNVSCRVIIDSLRNPLEITYFKERYSAYYTLAVNPDEEFQKKQLCKKYDAYPTEYQEINKIDELEYGDKNKKTDFYKQSVQKCIEKSDLHLSFIEDEHASPFNFYQQIVLFYSLMLQPGIVTPSPQERCMQIAYTAKYNSGCISRQVGAVITDEYYSVKSIGWNNIPEGQIPCLLRSSEELLDDGLRTDDNLAFSTYEKDTNKPFFKEFKEKFTGIDSTHLFGHNCSFCFKDIQNSITEGKNQVHTKSLHAEENAMMQIAKYGGQALKDGILFTTASPCELCAKKAYQLGISQIFYIDPYPGIAINQILDCGYKKPKLHLFTGAIGRAYHKLYEPFMPYKDEIYIRTGIEIQNKVSALEDKIKDLEKELEKQKKANSK